MAKDDQTMPFVVSSHNIHTEALGTTADALLRESSKELESLDDMLLSLPEEQRTMIRTAVIAMVHGLKSGKSDARL